MAWTPWNVMILILLRDSTLIIKVSALDKDPNLGRNVVRNLN